MLIHSKRQKKFAWFPSYQREQLDIFYEARHHFCLKNIQFSTYPSQVGLFIPAALKTNNNEN